ncbi:MAG TPA: nucleotide exchange factor GrpE, partial [Erysipelotrichaceae bacterium]|nr:nucleotide exchange factor GrpE [Erysipelotrichaceae bacterium]
MTKKKNSFEDNEDLDVSTVDVKDVDEKTLEEVEVEEEKDEDLNKKVSDLEDELAVLRNDFLLAHANLENTKKRLSNDFAKRSKYLASDFALSLLPAIDNMEKVLYETDDKDNPLYEAVDMMYRQLQTSLK